MNPLLERLFDAWTDVNDLSELEDRFAAIYTDPVRVNGTNVSPSDLALRARSLHRAFTDLRAEVPKLLEIATALPSPSSCMACTPGHMSRQSGSSSQPDLECRSAALTS